QPASESDYASACQPKKEPKPIPTSKDIRTRAPTPFTGHRPTSITKSVLELNSPYLSLEDYIKAGPSSAAGDTHFITSEGAEETLVDAEPRGKGTSTITKSAKHAKKSAMAKRKQSTRPIQPASRYDYV